MRPASADLIAFLNGNTRAIKRHLVTITLADSTVIRWTDNEADLAITRPAWPGDPEAAGTQTYTAGGTGAVPLLDMGKITDVPGTEIGDCELNLLCGETAQLNGVRLPLAVVNNALDKAKVKIERVYGVDAIDLTVGALWIFEGVVAEAKPTSTRVKLSLVDGREELQVQLPRTPVQPPCTAMLFDSQCSLVKASWTVTGTVSTGATPEAFGTSRTEADDYFKNGVITFTSGQNAGLDRGVRVYAHTGGTFTLDEPLPAAPANGDSFSVYPGCDKKMATCDGTFGNLVHFRGFPYLPSSQRNVTVYADTASRYPGIPSRYLPPYMQPGSDQVNPNPRFGQNQDQILPIVYGRAKVPARLVYLYQFSSKGQVLSDLVEAICEGPITGCRAVWWTAGEAARYSWTVYGVGSLALGTRPTGTDWTRANGNDAGAWTAYPGTACLRLESFPLDAVGGESLSIEVDGFQVGTGDSSTGDANPADIVSDLISYDAAKPYNAQFGWDVVTDTGTDGNAASSFRRYVTQAALWLSPVLDSKRPAIDWLGEILASCNASCRWSSSGLVIVPLGDQATGTYAPDTSIQYDLGQNDFAPASKDDDPIEVERNGREEVANVCPVTFLQRIPATDYVGAPAPGSVAYLSAAYQQKTIEDPEPVDLARNGIRRISAASMPMICREDVAMAISRLKAQRAAKARNTYRFRLPWRFRRLEPLDYLTLTDARFGFNHRVVRVTKIEEANDVLTVEADDAPIGHATAALNTTQSSEARSAPKSLSAAAQAHIMALRNWSIRTIPSAYYKATASNGSMLVAVGSDGAVTGKCASSPDGVAWTARTIGGVSFESVTWNGSLFCAVGQNSSCATSSDGITWSTQTIPAGSYFGVAWNGSVFCAVGSGVVATSPNGTTWTARTSSGVSHQSIAWNGSVFCAVGSKAGAQAAATSPDGITWTLRATPTDGTYYGVAWNGSVFCAVGAAGTGATSLDGVTWTAATVGTRTLRCLTWTGQVFVALDYGGAYDRATAYTSTDGSTWTTNSLAFPASGSNFGWLGIVWADTCAIAVSDNAVATSLAV